MGHIYYIKVGYIKICAPVVNQSGASLLYKVGHNKIYTPLGCKTGAHGLKVGGMDICKLVGWKKGLRINRLLQHYMKDDGAVYG